MSKTETIEKKINEATTRLLHALSNTQVQKQGQYLGPMDEYTTESFDAERVKVESERIKELEEKLKNLQS